MSAKGKPLRSIYTCDRLIVSMIVYAAKLKSFAYDEFRVASCIIHVSRVGGGRVPVKKLKSQ